ncbi:MAG TPA: methylmalonyl-CoA mutase family protein [Selenomonadales bacterium]|nr:methylmalonyl-CoA mutase family protein [Selenomonadales bacterium]
MPTTSDKQTAPADLPAVTFEEFSAPTYEQWKEEAIVALKGGVFEKKMFTKTYEGIQLEPLYTMEHTAALAHSRSYPGMGSYLRGTKASGYIADSWDISQVCDAPEARKCNELIRQELEKGSTAIHVALDTATREGRDADGADAGQVGDQGVSLSTLQDLYHLFWDVDMDKHDLQLYAGASSALLLGMICALRQSNGQPCRTLRGCIGADPVGALAGSGTLTGPLDELYDEMAHAAAWTAINAPAMKTILIHGDVYHNGGANAVQELAYVMATGIAYIKALQLRGLDIDRIAGQIRFSFSLGANFFMEIAKLRAARMLWAQIVEAFGGGREAQKIDIHARTSYFTRTEYDPYVNLLRSTSQAFSGIVGGAGSLNVSCFDEAIRSGDEFARRVARNTQIMLKNEFGLREPVDPAGGSWYIETITQQVAEKAWQLLQEIEEQGGMAAALAGGTVQEAVGNVLQQRFKKLAVRSDVAVGTNMYPNMTEQPLTASRHPGEPIQALRAAEIEEYRRDIDEQYRRERIARLPDAAGGQAGDLMDAVIQAFQAGATLGDIRRALNDEEEAAISVRPIAARRWTEQYEALRGRTEAYRAKTGKNLQVFLANMGKIPQHKARADFTTGFMEVAGFAVLKNDGFATVEEAAQEAARSGADAAVICSTDATYPELVPPLAKLIKEQCPGMRLLVAGAPAPEFEGVYREAGVDDFIHIRANCYQILADLQQGKGML